VTNKLLTCGAALLHRWNRPAPEQNKKSENITSQWRNPIRYIYCSVRLSSGPIRNITTAPYPCT